MGNLHSDVTEARLYEKFSPVGPVLFMWVCGYNITCFSLGYAYISIQKSAHAERDLDTMNFEVIKRKPIHIM